MLFDNRRKVSTPAERLRGVLDRLEVQLGKMEYSAADEVLQIPLLFDEIQRMYDDALAHPERGAVEEQARIDSLAAQFKRKAQPFLRAIGGTGALAKARAPYTPTEEQWWWFVDVWWAEQQRAQFQRRLKGGAVAAGALAVLVLMYMVFLMPDAATRNRYWHQQTAEQVVQEGDYVTALAEIEAALEFAPDDAELYVWRGVLLVVLEQPDASAVAFATAQSLVSNHRAFLTLRAQTYLFVLLPELALADAHALIADAPELAQGYFLLGRAYYLLRDYKLANENYERAAELAAETGDADLEAMARVQSAYLMQEMMGAVP